MISKEREKILDKGRKLKELADRGVGGEKETATRFLTIYKEKHNISDSELEAHKIKDETMFRGFTAEQIIEQFAQELVAKGLSIMANATRSTMANAFKLQNIKRKFDLKPEKVVVEWKYDANNYTFKGYVENILYFDIQQTKNGATLYRSRAIHEDKDFKSVDEAKSFCNKYFGD